MGAFVLVAARIDAERRAKQAELNVTDAKAATNVARHEISHLERRLRHSQRALSRVSERCRRQEDEIGNLERELKDATSRSGVFTDLPIPQPLHPRGGGMYWGGPLHWAREAILHFIHNQSIGLHVRVGISALATAAALWLCRGVFLACRGIYRAALPGPSVTPAPRVPLGVPKLN